MTEKSAFPLFSIFKSFNEKVFTQNIIKQTRPKLYEATLKSCRRSYNQTFGKALYIGSLNYINYVIKKYIKHRMGEIEAIFSLLA